MQSNSITEGINAVIDYSREFREETTVRKYEKACIIIQGFYEEQGLVRYSFELNDEIRCGYCRAESISGYTICRYVFRTLGMLDDYFGGRGFRDKYSFVSRYKRLLNSAYQQLVEEFAKSLTVKESSVAVICSIARDFFYYFQESGISALGEIRQEMLYEFMMWEYRDHKGSMGNVVYVVRSIIAFLEGRGILRAPIKLLPFSLPESKRAVYPAFSYEDMERILAQPDTGTVSGKRDYAVLILASVTGIRAVDIANLKLIDIQWQDMCINFIQSKTGKGLSLPLENRAALALSDYILNGRPKAGSPYVFLTESEPYRKLSNKSSVANILNKHIKRSGVEKVPRDGKTFHAFRRCMGSWLLDTSAGPELISQILGHQSQDSLKSYLPITTSKLGICALSFDGIEVQAEVYQ